MAVYFACLNHGDTILAMDLAHGGHLTHGMHLNFSGKWYTIVSYGVKADDERIDFDQVARLAREHKPKLVVAAPAPIRARLTLPSSSRSARMSARCSWWTWPTSPVWWRQTQHISPVPFADFCYVDDAQDLARSARRRGHVPARMGGEDQFAVFPGLQGGPLMHGSRPKAVSFAEALKPEFRRMPRKQSPTPGPCP